MTSVCLYFKVHQPCRLKKYQSKDIDVMHSYEDADANRETIDAAADNCYLPANELLYRSIKEQKGRFRVSFSISGTAIELLQQYRPDVLDSFKKLADTGCVEILAETYYHSLSFLHSKREFKRQVKKHSDFVKNIFGTEPLVFRNTELIYNNDLARFISGMGYKGILCEGVERILQSRTPNQLYAAPGNGDFGLLLRNTMLSDDIAFRFDDQNWSEHPLTAPKFASWLHAYPETADVINLFLDYETFGIHKKKETGIFDFLSALPEAVLENEKFRFSAPTEILNSCYPRDVYDVPQAVSWEDKQDVTCVWSRNAMQNNTLKKIYAIEKMIMSCGTSETIDTWGRLQAADHFYYMTEETFDNESSKYQNPFSSAEEAFRNYSNILVDFEISIIKNNINLTKRNAGDNLPAYNLY